MLPSGKRNWVPAVQEKNLNNSTCRSWKAGPEGRLSSREWNEWPRFGAYAPMVVDNEKPLLLDLGENNIVIPEVGLAASVAMLHEFLALVRQYYMGDDVLGTNREEGLASTPKCLMVNKDNKLS